LSAQGFVIASGDGTGNTAAPPDDPGWSHVGQPGTDFTAVYLGNNWMLTADHVTSGATSLDGQVHPWIPGSEVRFTLEGGTCPPWPASCSTLSDLEVYKIQGDVDLAALPIRSATPITSANVVMVGNGLNRGIAIRACTPPRDGWGWGGSESKRWGTNVVHQVGVQQTISGRTSRYFTTDFDDPSKSGATTYEAQASPGDSGGAAFVQNGGTWELAGIASAITNCGNRSLFGDLTYFVDLSHYRSAIESVVGVPPCDDGFDDDGDGLTDLADPGCADGNDLSERDPLLPCDDGVDNDGDGTQDFPADIGCASLEWSTENPACDDGIDNDGDGRVDWDGSGGTPDPDCNGDPTRLREKVSACGLGFELAALAPLLGGLRRGWRRRRALSPRAQA
jgi:hypothetical protein